MSDLNKLSMKEAIDGLRSKKFSSTELVKDHLKAIEAQNDLNIFITKTPELAIEGAIIADENIAKGNFKKLTGIPLGIKDLFCTKGTRTTAGSKILNNFVPVYESTVSAKLWAEGAVMLGKTSMDEFAMGSSNLTSHYGAVKNPWKANNSNEDLVPGGSSGGSASGVASFTMMGATASDTGGSIRQPASFCGIVGMKPTYGRCSRYGMVAYASSLDQAGVLTRDVTDCAIMLEAIMGHDEKDSTSENRAVPNLSGALNGSVKGMRIGIPKEYNVEGTDPKIVELWTKAAKLLEEEGAEIIEISLPHTKYALATYYIISPSEASSNLARYDGVRYGFRDESKQHISLDEMYELTRQAGFGAEVKRRIMIGTYVLSAGYYDAYYIKAQKVRSKIAQDFKAAFEKIDMILTPTVTSGAFALDYKNDDPVAMYLNDIYTIPASLAGLPCISVPAGLSGNGLPLGLQLIGNLFEEEKVITLAHMLENKINFPKKG
jgi:aspartyl-tRNA(Asn)/glutamyl-tRNA(Gln) amidotransferase subunit A